jgi:hypothetical protein
VIVLVAADDVEHHAAELLLNGGQRQTETPSNFSSQHPKPGGAGTWPKRTTFVTGFHAITAFARAPPADVPECPHWVSFVPR